MRWPVSGSIQTLGGFLTGGAGGGSTTMVPGGLSVLTGACAWSETAARAAIRMGKMRRMSTPVRCEVQGTLRRFEVQGSRFEVRGGSAGAPFARAVLTDFRLLSRVSL